MDKKDVVSKNRENRMNSFMQNFQHSRSKNKSKSKNRICVDMNDDVSNDDKVVVIDDQDFLHVWYLPLKIQMPRILSSKPDKLRT